MTSILGVLVAMKKVKGTRLPTARVSVVTSNHDGEIRLEEAFELVPRGDSLAEMLGDLGAAFANRVEGLKPDTVVVRRAEQPPRPSKKEGPKRRLLAEGALVYAATSVGARVVLLTGHSLAQKSGTTKPRMDEAAASLAPGMYKESVAAAMSVLSW